MTGKQTKSKAKSKKIRWGIIGSTGWAEHTFSPAIEEARGAELVAVLSSTKAKAAEFCERHKIDKGYSKLADFVADKSIDAVWVAGPNYLHKEQAVAALGAGKHVLCEKPMAISPAECRAMISAAKKARRKLHIAYNTRHSPKMQAIHKQWMAGRFGKPVHGRAHLYYPYPEDLGGWHSREKQVGSWVFGDIGTHLIDQLRWFLGDAKKVMAAHTSSPSWGYGTPDHAAAMISFKNGAVGTLSASTGLAPGKGRLEFYGDQGYIIIENGILGMPGSITTGIKNGKERTVELPSSKTYKLQVEAFGRCITSKEPFPLTPEDGLANVQLISQARGW